MALHIWGAEQAPTRLDKVLVEAFGLSRARAKEVLEDGLVRVDGRRMKKGDLVSPGAKVELPDAPANEADPATVPPEPEPGLPVGIVYVDEHLVVLDKPAGMSSHPLQPGERGTAANFLAGRFPQAIAVAPAQAREAGLVQRLDRETSGLLCAALDAPSHAALRTAFGERTVEKHYLAIVEGPLVDEGEVDVPLGHDPRDARKMLTAGGPEQVIELKARDAHTTFRVQARRGDFSLLEVGISTGVMHQIRVHLAAIGVPIVGDALYGGRLVPGLSRHALHAERLALAHPVSGVRLALQAPLPDELQRLWNSLPV